MIAWAKADGPEMEPQGPKRRGFTLLEVSICLVLVVTLAWIATPHFERKNGRAPGPLLPRPPGEALIEPKSKVHETALADILKKDCEHLVEGQLLFQPEQQMKEGSTYLTIARITRNPSVDITKDIDSSHFTIQTASVSCEVSMSLDGEEEGAFTIVKSPADRADKQYVEANAFTEWRWNVTPKKSGTLHLLLYVTPELYVEGVSEPMEKDYPQPARVITVRTDYLYAARSWIAANWVFLSALFSSVIIPMAIWGFKKIVSARQGARDRKKAKGFGQYRSDK